MTILSVPMGFPSVINHEKLINVPPAGGLATFPHLLMSFNQNCEQIPFQN
jgi:hypothetical protein